MWMDGKRWGYAGVYRVMTEAVVFGLMPNGTELQPDIAG